MAHIGALRVIERAGIPIDIITGTSIGSLIGGLYAIGYDAEKLDSLVRAQDWGFCSQTKPTLRREAWASGRWTTPILLRESCNPAVWLA